MQSVDLAWFAQRTDAAAEVLRTRAELFAREATGDDLVTQLAGAGEVALAAAVSAGESRAAALDLLAADALITLALLAQAERAPGSLGEAARALRKRAMT